uniref:Uncharacterized protein n=1 Tax=Tetranychus urticae TaxID=32264 RepID=T1JPV4_TETUR
MEPLRLIKRDLRWLSIQFNIQR